MQRMSLKNPALGTLLFQLLPNLWRDPQLSTAPHSIHLTCEMGCKFGWVNHQLGFFIAITSSRAANILNLLFDRKCLLHFRCYVVDKCDHGDYILSKFLPVCLASVLHLILDTFRWCRLASWLSIAHLYWWHCIASFAAWTGRFHWVMRMLSQVKKLYFLVPGLRRAAGENIFWASVKLWLSLKVLTHIIPYSTVEGSCGKPLLGSIDNRLSLTSMITTFDNQLPFPSSQFQTRPFWCLVGMRQELH